MADARGQARRTLEDLAAAWLAGDRAGTERLLDAEVSWWTPMAADTLRGPDAVASHLVGLAAGFTARPEVTGVLVNDDGTRGVLEVSTGAPRGAATTVVTFDDGRVVEGRTYVDVPSQSGAAR